MYGQWDVYASREGSLRKVTMPSPGGGQPNLQVFEGNQPFPWFLRSLPHLRYYGHKFRNHLQPDFRPITAPLPKCGPFLNTTHHATATRGSPHGGLRDLSSLHLRPFSSYQQHPPPNLITHLPHLLISYFSPQLLT